MNKMQTNVMPRVSLIYRVCKWPLLQVKVAYRDIIRWIASSGSHFAKRNLPLMHCHFTAIWC
jgi:hypothetical protein